MRHRYVLMGLALFLSGCNPMNYGPTLEGDWALVSVHHSPVAQMSVTEAAEWIGQAAEFREHRVVVGERHCAEPVFQTDWQSLKEVLDEFELPADAFSMPPDAPVQTLAIECGGEPWEEPGGQLVRLNEKRLLVLWEGIFFELHPA